MSNYPGGFAEGISIRGLPVQVAHPGKVFWVNGSSVLAEGGIAGSNGNPGTYQKPFATIDYAVGRCTASRGDIIMVMPGHVETVSAAAGLALDVAGVAVIGLGQGALRAKVNLTATASTVAISAASVSLYNILFTGGIDAVVSAIVVSAADVTLKNCEIRDVTGQIELGILTTAAANRLLVEGLVYSGDSAAGGVSAIALVGGDSITIRDFKLNGNFSTSAIDIKTTATTNLSVHDGYIWTKNAADLCIKDTITASTGRIGPNLNLMLTDNAANITEAVTGATFHVFDPVYVCNLAGEKAMLMNWTASTDA
jgi:hypothetical protein